MKNYTIRRYASGDYDAWNSFIGKAKNATFLFHRDYMEYHADRFEDYSLIVLDNKKWTAVLPANRVGDCVYSHQGLTYGGLIYDDRIKLPAVICILSELLKFLSENAIKKMQVKTVPAIYYDRPSDELNYALFTADAKLIRRDSLSVLDLTKPFKISKDRLKAIRRGERNGLIIKEEAAFAIFWDEILIPNMKKKHGVNPVHTIAEIEKLHLLFPKNIRHFNVYHQGKIVAGTTIFVTKNVIHPQYISGEKHKNELGSLDYLYHCLIADVFRESHYFDFGISNESNGKQLNESLIFWKESFGTGTIVQDFYEVATENYKLLDTVLI